LTQPHTPLMSHRDFCSCKQGLKLCVYHSVASRCSNQCVYDSCRNDLVRDTKSVLTSDDRPWWQDGSSPVSSRQGSIVDPPSTATTRKASSASVTSPVVPLGRASSQVKLNIAPHTFDAPQRCLCLRPETQAFMCLTQRSGFLRVQGLCLSDGHDYGGRMHRLQ
jgi:hypothetical protein